MARFFNTTGFLHRVGAVVAAAPLTISAWGLAALASGTQRTYVSITDNLGALNGFWLVLAAGSVSAYTGDGAIAPVSSVGPVDLGVWHHVAGVWASAASRTAYYNGAAGGTDVTACTPGALTVTDIGTLNLANPAGQYLWSDNLAEIAVWNAALTQAEITMLAAGVSALLVRRESLRAYWPIGGYASPEQDLIGRNEMVVTSAAFVAGGPRILAPDGRYMNNLAPYVPTPPVFLGPHPRRTAFVEFENRRVVA